MNFGHFSSRRQRAAEAIGSDAVLVLFSAPQRARNRDVLYDYRQDSDFFYLTGVDEPEAALVVEGGKRGRSTLFVAAKNPERETWDGSRLGVEGAFELGFHECRSVDALAAVLPELLVGKTDLVSPLSPPEPRLLAALGEARKQARAGRVHPVRWIDSDTVVHEMRRLKEGVELLTMQRAADASIEAHRQAMRAAAPGRFEYEIQSVLEQSCRASGHARMAYPSIVASGANATTLHYVKNDRRMREGDLLLIDAGCEHEYYASDITRTFPVSGRFTEAQRSAYEVVLSAQKAAIECCRPGSTLDDIHEAAVRALCEGLCELGVIGGAPSDAFESGAFRPFYMHKTSHYLGMDVHDVGRYYDKDKPRPLEPGVVITVEPGLYFSGAAPPHLRGIGVRIEDDILIDAGGPKNLTAALPKEVEDVEALCGGR